MSLEKGFTLEQLKVQQTPFTVSKDALIHISINGVSKVISLKELYYLFFKETLQIGSFDSLESFGISINNGSSFPPGIKYNKNSNKWMYSNNGQDWFEFGTGSSDPVDPPESVSVIPVRIDSYDETTNTAQITTRVKQSDGSYTDGESKTITNADWTK